MGVMTYKWEGFDTVTLVRDHPSTVNVKVNGELEAVPPNQYIVKSAPLYEDCEITLLYINAMNSSSSLSDKYAIDTR